MFTIPSTINMEFLFISPFQKLEINKENETTFFQIDKKNDTAFFPF